MSTGRAVALFLLVWAGVAVLAILHPKGIWPLCGEAPAIYTLPSGLELEWVPQSCTRPDRQPKHCAYVGGGKVWVLQQVGCNEWAVVSGEREDEP